jgi:hypothetical protein
MMSEMKPALTAEEWAARSRFGKSVLGGSETEGRAFLDEESERDGDSSLVITYDSAVVAQAIPTDEVLRVIALANAALPDDSPYKITHDDVDVARGMFNPGDDRDAMILRLAAKLEALLNPRDG